MTEIEGSTAEVPATMGYALSSQTQATPVQEVDLSLGAVPFNQITENLRSLEKFDPALGLLTSIRLRVDLTVIGTGIAVDFAIFGFPVPGDVVYTRAVVEVAAPDGSGLVIVQTGILEGGAAAFTLGTGFAPFSTQVVGSSNVQTENDPDLLALFTGSGTLDIPYQVLAGSVAASLIVDPTGTTHEFFGKLLVEYIYDPTLPSAPRPESLAIDRSGESQGAVIVAGASRDTVRGTQGNDVIIGGAGRDTLDGEGGNDLILNISGGGTIRGGAGDDVLVAGFGENVMEGGDGDDVILGGFGNDSLNGGAGDDLILGDPVGAAPFAGADIIEGGPGNDRMMGGAGHDVFIFRDEGGTNEIAAYAVDLANPAAATRTGADFVPGVDRIAFAPGTLATADEVFAAMEDVDGSATITFGGTTLTVFGVTEAELKAEDFLFADWFQ
jgi:Ca2+-binding RTX toxin-like protein